MDDIVTIDFQGFHNEKALKEVRNENFSVDMGTGYLGEDFEERLVGVKKASQSFMRVTSCRLPESYYGR